MNIKKYEVRYSSELYSNALYGEYNSWTVAVEEMERAKARAIEHGQADVAKSFHIC